MSHTPIFRAFGILSTFGAAALLIPLASCRSPVAGTAPQGRLVVSVTLPAAVPAGGSAALAAGGEARFIHPDTRRIFVEVEGDDIGTPLSSSADLGEGQTTATVKINAIPEGSARTVTVTLYGAEGPPLARAATTVDIQGGETVGAELSPVPVEYRILVPGPYGASGPDGVPCGAVLGALEANSAAVYRASVPKSGAYRIRVAAGGALPVGGFELYDAEGRSVPVSSAPETAEYGAFTAAAGTYYLLVDSPASGIELVCELDADLFASYAGPVISADHRQPMMDRARPASIRVSSGAAGAVLASVSGETTELTAAAQQDGTILISPPFAERAAPFAADISFTDALLGFPRTLSGIALPAPRTVRYVAASGSDAGDGSFAAPMRTLAAAAAAVAAGSDEEPVILVSAQGTVAETGAVEITKKALILGGAAVDGSRSAAAPLSTVLVAADNASGYAASVSAAGTLVDGIEFRAAATTYPESTIYSFLQVSADLTLRRCTLVAGDSANAMEYCFVLVVGSPAVDLHRCSILGGTFSGATAGSAVVYGLYSNGGSPTVTIVNSVVHPGTLTPGSSSGALIRGVQLDQAASTLRLIGSTVSSGFLSASLNKPATDVAAVKAAGALRVFNNLLLLDNAWRGADAENAAYALAYSPAEAYGNVRYNFFGYQPQTGTPLYLVHNGGPLGLDSFFAEDCGNSDAWSSLVDGLALAGFVRTAAPGALDFRPTAASPASVRFGGAALSSWSDAALGFAPSAEQRAELALDRDGKARSGAGSAGWSLGAYEY